MADEQHTTINGHSVKYSAEHDSHMELGLKWLHNHHSEAEEMFKTLKNGEEPDKKGYMKFTADGYTFRLYRKSSGGYEVKWQQA